MIHEQMTRYLDVNKILAENQYGFRNGRSTSMAIFEVLKNLYGNWNENNFSGCVFVDFSPAFDTVDHNILHEKLKLYGFDEMPLKFIKEYMASRNAKNHSKWFYICESTCNPWHSTGFNPWTSNFYTLCE